MDRRTLDYYDQHAAEIGFWYRFRAPQRLDFLRQVVHVQIMLTLSNEPLVSIITSRTEAVRVGTND